MAETPPGAGAPLALPAPVPPTLAELSEYVGALLGAERYAPSEHGVFAPSDRPVGRLGLALEGDAATAAWAVRAAVDALWLHRPWRLPRAALAAEVGVAFTHLPFDDRLTTALNPRLAAALGGTDVEPFGEKEGRVIGMLARVATRPAAVLAAVVGDVFGGVDAWLPPADADAPVRRVAVVGAMNDALVRAAAERGVGLYVTGQLRVPALAAVRATGMAVAAVGHVRAEWWGVRALGALVGERWSRLEVVTRAPGDGSG